MMTTSINYTLDVGFHSDSMYKSYGEITAPEVKKKQEIVILEQGETPLKITLRCDKSFCEKFNSEIFFEYPFPP